MSTDRDYLAAGLALGGLSDSEFAEAQTLADSDADFRSEVAAYADIMAEAAESDEPVEVSSATREAILAIPQTHAQQRSTNEPLSPATQTQANSTAAHPVSLASPTSLADHRESRRRSWLPYAAAAAALIVAAGSGVTVWQQTQRQNQLEDDLTAAQQQLDDSTRLMQADDLRTSTDELPEGGTVTVSSSESEQLIRISPDGVGRVPEGKALQMWVIGDEGPESAGLMTGESTTIAGHAFTDASVFGITIEPEGGSDQPTTDPVVAIDL
ncbi:anti-sigma factor [Brevibacterium sediminis]|uniref:anti-sigma factor n=1 Tax=Brevibacterium sediminis TaxID=1857024 RepID=UPI002174E3B4|nr:anti-sigma factor [Brevibacterium sediminis]MCS4594560.1 anti-sigma factor [Brevibacterium sediminis]